MGYTLHVLDDKQFDALRIKNPRYRTEDALGFADTKTKTAYVRRTGINTLDQFVTAHELEELVNKYSDHEIDGIRYKKGRDIIAPVMTAVASIINPFLGMAAAGGYGAYKQAKGEQNLGQTLINTGLAGLGGAASSTARGGQTAGQAFKAGANIAKEAGGGLLKQTASGVGSVLGFAPSTTGAVVTPAFGGASGVGTTISKVPGAAANAILPSGVNALSASNMAAGLTPLATAAANPVLNSINRTMPAINSNAMNWSSPVTSSSLSTAPITEKVSSLPNIMNTGTTNIGTGNSMGINSTNPMYNSTASSNLGFQGTQQTASTPAKKSIIDTIWDKYNTPLGQTVAGAAVPLIGSAFSPKIEPFSPDESQMYQDLSQRIMAGTPKLTMTPEQKQAITANYDDQLESAKQEIINRWKAARPGSDITNDTQLQQALKDLENDYAIQKANAITATELGLTQQQTEMMSELAAMDIYTLQQKAGIQAQEAKDFKKMLSDMGFMVAGNAIYNK